MRYCGFERGRGKKTLNPTKSITGIKELKKIKIPIVVTNNPIRY